MATEARYVRLKLHSTEERTDDLLPARGILVGALLGGAAWTIICSAVWLIFH